jgi:hypothetical protein
VDIEAIFRDIDANGDFVRRLCYRVAHLFLSLPSCIPSFPA